MSQSSLDLGLPSKAADWNPTRDAAQSRLDCFVEAAGSQYARQRNFDFGAGKHAKVSQLSPWIRHRLSSPHFMGHFEVRFPGLVGACLVRDVAGPDCIAGAMY